MEILFFGSTEFSVPFLKELYNSKHNISMVVTTPDKKRGRGKKLLSNPVKNSAFQMGIDFIQCESLDDRVIERILEKRFNCIIVVSFGMIIPKIFIDMLPGRCINVHPSILPKYRGPSPITGVLLNGEEKTGVSIIKMTERLDAGDIYAQNIFGVNSNDNKDVLEEKLIEFGKPLLITTLSLIEKEILMPIPQDESSASYTSMVTKKDLKIDWNDSAVKTVNRIRAFSTKPGCYSLWLGKVIKILKASILVNEDKKRLLKSLKTNLEEYNGTVLKADSKEGLLIGCRKNDILKIELLKPQGKNLMTALDFINGYPVKAGNKFE